MLEQPHYHTSDTSGASPGESPYLSRITWASYKGLSRGQLGGIALGGLVGLGVGIAATAVVALFVPLGMPFVAAAVLGATAIGAKYYHDVFKEVGAISGAVAAGMEIGEERSQVLNIKLDTILNVMAKKGEISPEEVKIIEDDVESVYQTGARNVEKKFTKPEPFFWKVGLVGAVAGVLLLAAMGGVGYVMAALSGHVIDLGAFFAANTTMIATAAAGSALAGASYGINRNLYRNVIDVTNALYEGDLSEIAKQRAKHAGIQPSPSLPDFTPVPPPAQNVPLLPVPGTAVSAAKIDNLHGREILAQRLGDAAGWREIHLLRAEEAAREPQPRVH